MSKKIAVYTSNYHKRLTRRMSSILVQYTYYVYDQALQQGLFMEMNHVRVRFAPSPTGLMHLGGVRTALFNYLFAKKYNGTFIIRIEDTDLERNFDPGGKEILKDLAWLGLAHEEGPDNGGPYAPYLQSERSALYQEKLTFLHQHHFIYRCFCTVEELERKRKRQIALKLPPRYDRTCCALPADAVEEKLKNGTPFIWRFKIDIEKKVEFIDLARGTIVFDLSHFSDFPLTRQDGSFTFLFVNAVDDIVMNISHVLRGEDHLSNTASQVTLYHAFNHQLPIFWHLPIICNVEGKKLSKRDFGFSLKDLQQAGFLPEALCNYLAIIGSSFKQEIMSLTQLADAIDFAAIHSTGAIRYDLEKLKWVNQQWIATQYTPEQLTTIATPFLVSVYPQAAQLPHATMLTLIKTIQAELVTLKDIPHVLQFYFEEPIVTHEKLLEHVPQPLLDQSLAIIEAQYTALSSFDLFFTHIKEQCKAHNVPLKTVLITLRLLLSGSPQGPSIKEMITLLGNEVAQRRLLKTLADARA